MYYHAVSVLIYYHVVSVLMYYHAVSVLMYYHVVSVLMYYHVVSVRGGVAHRETGKFPGGPQGFLAWWAPFAPRILAGGP